MAASAFAPSMQQTVPKYLHFFLLLLWPLTIEAYAYSPEATAGLFLTSLSLRPRSSSCLQNLSPAARSNLFHAALSNTMVPPLGKATTAVSLTKESAEEVQKDDSGKKNLLNVKSLASLSSEQRRDIMNRIITYVAIFAVGLKIGQRKTVVSVASSVSAAPRKFPVLNLFVAAWVVRELWGITPAWVKRNVFRRRRRVSSAATSLEELDMQEVDPDDMTSLASLSQRLQGIMKVASSKLSSPMGAVELRMALLILLQLLVQLKDRRAEARDGLYDISGDPIKIESEMKDFDESFEFADWAYDEDPRGNTLAENLKSKGFFLLRHDKTAIPGYVGHYVAIHPEKKIALIGVKGTSNFEDLLTDCCGNAVTYELNGPFVQGGASQIRCHEGILISSKRLADVIQPFVEELFLPAGYRIVVTGHSLGAGAGTILGILLRSRLPALISPTCRDGAGEGNGNKGDEGLLKVLAFASPPVLDYDASLSCSSFVTTIVNNSDIIPRASMANLIIMLEVLKVVKSRMEEQGLSFTDGTSSLALIKKLYQGKDGDMILSPEEIGQAVDAAKEKVPLRDPDHLYVGGKVIVMYDTWEKKHTDELTMKQSEEEVEKGTTDKDKNLLEQEDEENEKLFSKDAAERAFISDGTARVLRLIEIDERMVSDHMSPSYRSSIRSLLSQTNL